MSEMELCVNRCDIQSDEAAFLHGRCQTRESYLMRESQETPLSPLHLSRKPLQWRQHMLFRNQFSLAVPQVSF
jgi:hypothetical protein